MKISIITAVRNGAATIGDCIESIRQQTIPVEHIIIDGCSTDETLNIVKSNNLRYISEPDKGIYDAMNKGIQLASGEIVGILNADDFYSHGKVFEKVVSIFENPDTDSCYGDLVYIDHQDTERIIRYWRSGSYNPDQFYQGWMPPHPTFFVRRKIYEKYGLFDLSLGSAADYELMLRFLLKHGISSVYIPEVLIRMRTGGISNISLKNRLRANHMDRIAWTINGLKPYWWTMWMKPLRKIGQYFIRAR